MHFTLRQKISVVFTALLLIAAFISLQSIQRFNQLGQAIDVILRENYSSVLACQQMKDALERVDSGTLFVLAGYEKEGREQIAKNLERFQADLAIELHNLTLPREPQEAMSLQALFNSYREKLDQFLARHPADAGILYFQTIFPLFQKIKNKADDILQMNQENMNEANNRARVKATKARREMYLFLLISFFSTALFLLFSNRWILKPIQRLIASTMEIRKGNLNLVIPVDTQDEIGQLSEAFNAMVASLRLFRRSDQARLARMQRSTQEAFKNIPDVIIILDTEGLIEIATEPARAHFGLQPNTKVADTPYPWLASLYREAMKKVSFPGMESKAEIVQHFIHNQERFFQPKARPILNSENELTGLIIFLDDVTLLKQNDEMKRDLFSTLSHQLKTPLTSIRMALHLLLEEKIGSLNEKQADLLVSAREDSERLYGIIADILDLSRIEAGNIRMNLIPTVPQELVSKVLEPFQRQAQDRGILLQATLPADLPDVLVDQARIGHVFANLLSNAIKFTPCGGKIMVTAKAEKGKVAFQVSDTGRGIPKKYHSKIFEKFFRIPGSEMEGGEGLGLAIAREIIKAHGGEISFASAEGKGTTFTFTLKKFTEPELEKKNE